MRSLSINLSITTRWMLALVVVVAIGMALFMRNKSRDRDGASAIVSTVESVAEPARPVDPRLDVEAAIECSSAEAERTAVPESEEEPERSKPRPGSGKVWKGRVEFVREELPAGGTYVGETNELTFGFRCAGRVLEHTVALNGDTFEFEVPFHADDIEEVLVLHAFARRRNWRPADGCEALGGDAEAGALVRLQPFPQNSLELVDASKGDRILRCVLELEPSGERMSGDDGALHALRSSRTDARGILRLRIFADLYAPRSIALDLTRGGAHVVRLVRSGGVAVRWNVPEDLRTKLGRSLFERGFEFRVEPVFVPSPVLDDEFAPQRADVLTKRLLQPLLRSMPEAGPVSVRGEARGLLAGEYRVVASTLALPLTKPRDLVAASVVIRSSEVSEVELVNLIELELPLPKWTVELVLPEDYGSPKALSLVLRPPDAAAGQFRFGTLELSQQESSRTWRSGRFSADRGTFTAELSLDPSSRAQVAFDGPSDSLVRVEFPRPFRYQVRLRSRAHQAPPLPRRVQWRTASPDPKAENHVVRQGEGSIEIATVAPAIEVALTGATPFRLAGASWARLEGGGEHVLDLVPGPHVRLAVLDEGRPVDVPGLLLSVRATKSSARSRLLFAERIDAPRGDVSEALLWFAEPGTYELTFPKLLGFEPLPPQSVEVVAGRSPVLTLDLVRKR